MTMGGQLRTPKLSLADAGGGASSDIVTTFALFLILRLPKEGHSLKISPVDAKDSSDYTC